MNVLFIGKRFYTNRDALREKYGRIYQLPWHWAETGISTRLWLADYHTRECLRQRDGDLEVLSTPVRNLSVFRRWMAARAGRGRKPDVVIASGDCYIGLMAYRIARRLRARFVFDVYDKYDEFSGYRRLPGFDPFRFLLRRADARLFASRALMDALDRRTSGDLFVPNGIDPERFHMVDKQAARQAFDLPCDATVIGYFGSIDRDRGVLDLINAVQQLRGDGQVVELLLGGVITKGISLDQPGVRYLGNLPFAKIPMALGACDVLALPYRNSSYLDMASSCKIAEYMAAHRPIVATRTPNLVGNFPTQAAALSNLLAEPGDPRSIASAIRKQLQHKVVVDPPTDMSWKSIAGQVALHLFN